MSLEGKLALDTLEMRSRTGSSEFSARNVSCLASCLRVCVYIRAVCIGDRDGRFLRPALIPRHIRRLITLGRAGRDPCIVSICASVGCFVEFRQTARAREKRFGCSAGFRSTSGNNERRKWVTRLCPLLQALQGFTRLRIRRYRVQESLFLRVAFPIPVISVKTVIMTQRGQRNDTWCRMEIAS